MQSPVAVPRVVKPGGRVQSRKFPPRVPQPVKVFAAPWSRTDGEAPFRPEEQVRSLTLP